MATPLDRAAEAVKDVPMPDRPLRYGTAGFRERAEVLASTMVRVGLVSALRSMQLGKVRARRAGRPRARASPPSQQEGPPLDRSLVSCRHAAPADHRRNDHGVPQPRGG
jgi:hypothetical protein